MMTEPLPIPKHPLQILLPFPTHQQQPSPSTLNLLRKLCNNHLTSTETYSITFSPLTCPNGKNYLFTLKPYYWEIEPGRWDCDSPKGQKQLQKMCVAIWTLALGSVHLLDLEEECVQRAEQILRVFFLDPETRMLPQIRYAQCHPGQIPLKGDYAFIIACRYLVLVTPALALLSSSLTHEVTQGVKRWFADHVDWMEKSAQGQAARECTDNKSIWYHACYATHLNNLHPPLSTHCAIQTLQTLIQNYPTSAAYFARDLKRTRPRHYTLFSLEPLFILSSLTSSSQRSPQQKEHNSEPAPAGWAIHYLRLLVDYAKDVPGSEIEVDIEGGGRYGMKLGWFERILGRWSGVDDVDQGEGDGHVHGDQHGERNEEVEEGMDDWPDGSGWEGGWDDWMRVQWGFI